MAMKVVIQRVFTFTLELAQILSKSLTTISPVNKMLAKVTMTLIVPLVISIVVPMHIVARFFQLMEKFPIQMNIDEYESHYNIHLSYHIEILITVLLYRILYITISMTTISFFYLLSYSLIVNIIASASMNTSKGAITFLKAVKFVPMVQLTVTFICMFWMLFAYHLVSFILMIKFSMVTINTIQNHHGRVFIITLLLSTYCLGFLYLGIVSQLARVISTLESFYGIKAMIKATRLVKGSADAALLITIIFNVYFFGLGFCYINFTLLDKAHMALVSRVLTGIIISVLLVIGFLLNMVIQTQLYLECKAHHGENIDLKLN